MATKFPSCDAALLLYDDMTCEVDMHNSLKLTSTPPKTVTDPKNTYKQPK
jgi:hypothetical protein